MAAARRRALGHLLAALVLAAARAEILPLSDQANWRLDNSRGFQNVTLGALGLPVAALQALHEAGIVDDPLWRFNERELRWAAFDNWTFSLEFDAPPGLLRQPSVLLRCGGLDTEAAVELNGALVGQAANAHRPHAWEVRHLLQEGSNSLAITLFSAPAAAAQRAARYPYAVPVTAQAGALPHYNFARKAASDFGWDWGPAFAPAAISGPIELLGRGTAVLDGVAVRQRHFANGSVAVTAVALLLPPPAAGAAGGQAAAEQGQLGLELTAPDGQRVWRAQQGVAISTEAGGDSACSSGSGSGGGGSGDGDGGGGGGDGSTSCPWLAPEAGSRGAAAQPGPPLARRSIGVLIDQPELWWPHDLGQQPLYQLRLTYTPASNSSGGGAGSGSGGPPAAEAASPAAEGPAAESPAAGGGGSGSGSSSLTRRIGLRLVQLVTQPLPGVGESFFFRVNGQPLYARGANVVPAHIFEPAVSAAQLQGLVADAKAAHMNMLRVWGGGRYAQDAFYDACDSQGVLVWQEAMFACAMYPADDAFLQEAWLEVRHQAARLSSHPSIAIWGGNNENEAAFTWFNEPLLNPRPYAADYSRLFVDVVRQAVLSVDPALPFVDSSPSNGLLSASPYAKRWGDVSDPRFGDVHFYNYQADALDPATYPPAKFVSEFGFMSLPSFSTYQRATAPEDWSLAAPMTAYRMRHAGGLEELAAQMQLHFLAASPLDQPLGARRDAAAAPAEQQQAAVAAAGDGRPASREQRLAQLAAGQAALVQAFDAAEAAGRNPVEAVHAAAAAAGNSSVAAADPAAAAAVGAPAAEQQQQQQREAGLGGTAAGPAAPPEQRRFEAFTYLSQLQQGLAYQTAVHQWRRNKADPAAATMGVLYWQLNDIWAGPSWSGINADGSWRLLHHFAADFFRPVLVSGLRDAASGALEVHLTNDLPVGVTGTLAIDAIPFGAARPEDVVPLYRSDAASVQPFASGLVWSGTIAADVLPAVGSVPDAAASNNGSSGSHNSSSGSGSRPAEAPDVFLRLRFCPSGVEPQGAAVGAPQPPNPFGPTASQAATAALALALGSAPPADRAAAASDGGGGDSAPACDGAPIALPPGASAAQCAAASRLLHCSESLLFLTELKDARLAPANVSAKVAAAGQDGGGGGEAGGAAGGGFEVSLSSDAVALFVSPEAQGPAGRFNASGLLLLPWQPQAVAFLPAVAAAGGRQAGAFEGGSAAAPPALEAATPAVEREDGPGDGVEGSSGPAVSVYRLQQAMADLQPPAASAAGGAAAASAATNPAGLLLRLQAVLCAFVCCMLLRFV